MNSILSFAKFIWYYSGALHIWRKLYPKETKKPYPTLLLWIIGIYFAIYSIASQGYENRINLIENKANLVLSIVVNPETRKAGLSQVPQVQNMRCPVKPSVKNFWLTFQSFFGDTQPHSDAVESMQKILFAYKKELTDIDLSGVILSNVNMEKADFRNTILRTVYFDSVSFVNANFDSVDLSRSSLKECDFGRTSFIEVNVRNSYFEKCNFSHADIRGLSYDIENISLLSTGMGLFNYNLIEMDKTLKDYLEIEYPVPFPPNVLNFRLVNVNYNLDTIYHDSLKGIVKIKPVMILEEKNSIYIKLKSQAKWFPKDKIKLEYKKPNQKGLIVSMPDSIFFERFERGE